MSTPVPARRLGLSFTLIGPAVVAVGICGYFILASPKRGVSKEDRNSQPIGSQPTAPATTPPAETPTTAVPTAAALVFQQTVDESSRSESSTTAVVDWKSIIRSSAELATVPSVADYSARGWDELTTRFPSFHWADTKDEEFAFAKRAELPLESANPSAEVTDEMASFVLVKGARTMIIQTVIHRYDPAGERHLDSVLEAVLVTEKVRCDSEERAGSSESWYRVSPTGSKAISGKYDLSGGSAGVLETLTFQAVAATPQIGADAIDGKWTDKCRH